MSENAGTTNEKVIYYNGEFISVSNEVYQEYCRPIWRQLKKMKNLKKCSCPKKRLYSCTGECYECKYHKGADVSLDDLLEKRGDLPDEKSMDFVDFYAMISDEELVEKLINELDRSDENARVVVQMKLEGSLDKDVADVLNLSTSTFSDRKKRLYKIAKNFFEKN